MNPFWVFVVVLVVGLLLRRVGRSSSGRPSLVCPYDLSQPPPGSPVVVSVASGDEISFSVDVHNTPYEVVCDLLGDPREGRVERPTRVRVSRDYSVLSSTSIRVDTVDGRLVGHVSSTEAAVACILIGKIMADLPAHHPEVADRPLVIDANAQVAGQWSASDGFMLGSLSRLTVIVKDPAEIDLLSS